jgi:hypothetical protein
MRPLNCDEAQVLNRLRSADFTRLQESNNQAIGDEGPRLPMVPNG